MPSAATRLLLFGRNRETLNTYLATLPFLALYKMQQTAGTNEPNVGSLGSAVDMTITSTTLGQTGKLGPNEAYLFDGANSRLQVANNATLSGKTAWEWVFLVNPSSAGESSFGLFFCWSATAITGQPLVIFSGAINSIEARIYNTTPTQFATITNGGMTAGTWALLFVAYDDAGDRLVHIRKGVSGAVTEYPYFFNPALTGTYRPPTQALNLFNTGNQTFTFAGLADLAGVVDGNLTVAQRLKITQLVGV